MFKKDLQYYKFCLYGFLKNQKFYEPFFFLFLLSKDISYLQIGILYSIREITINILEIPAGVIADSAGRRRTMIISFIFYIASFCIFYFSNGYLFLISGMIVFGFGEVFRTGTHKAMIFDYLKENRWSDQKVTYYGNTRSWSQLGSALSSIIAALIVILSNNYKAIFAFAIIPYVLNFINIASYPSTLDGNQQKFRVGKFSEQFMLSLRSLHKSFRLIEIRRLYINSSLPGSYFKAVKDYLQPLILAFIIGIPILSRFTTEDKTAILIGVIYFIIYILTSRASRQAGKLTTRSGSMSSGLNITYIMLVIAGFIAGLGFHLNIEVIAIAAFICIFLFENVRRPIAVGCISEKVDVKSLATYLSIDSQFRSLFAILISPIIGILADVFSPGAGISIIAVLLLIVFPFIRIQKSNQS